MNYKNKVIEIIKRMVRLLSPTPLVKAEISVLAPNELLKGRKALVTGGTSGIGFQIARSFLNAGCNVTITGRSQARVDEACKKILTENPAHENHLWGIEMDVTKVDTLEHIFETIEKKMNGLDILVNNAGLEGGHINKATEADFDAIVNTNIKGVFFLSRIVARYMISKKVSGNILNLCSSSSLRPANSVYTMSKWAVRSLTEGLARMLIPYNIVVNGIAPGMTATPMLHKNDSNDDLGLNYVLTGRYAIPEEIANMAVILVSNICRMVVGDVLYMTGGSGIIYHEDVDYKFDF